MVDTMVVLKVGLSVYAVADVLVAWWAYKKAVWLVARKD